jgi:hypothetical protein
MHDFRVLRDQVEALRNGMRRRGKLELLGPVIDRGVALDVERRAMIQAVGSAKRPGTPIRRKSHVASGAARRPTS